MLGVFQVSLGESSITNGANGTSVFIKEAPDYFGKDNEATGEVSSAFGIRILL